MKLPVSFAAMFTLLFFACGCVKDAKQRDNDEYLPSLDEIALLQKQNAAGEPISDPETVFKDMANYPIIAFGHNHIQEAHYLAFRKMIPKLRANGILLLAVEEPTSSQAILDSIMSQETPPDITKGLLSRLNADFKQTDFNKKYDPNPKVIHPLIDVILDWLNSGGIVAAVDVPYIYIETDKTNLYQTEIMYRAIRENSQALYDAVKGVDIDNLDDRMDLRVISEVRSAYMAATLSSYAKKGIRTVAFVGQTHSVLKVQGVKTVSASIVQIEKKYFGQPVLSLYPHRSDESALFYKGQEWLGNYAYRSSE